jgi:hypothetical protein
MQCDQKIGENLANFYKVAWTVDKKKMPKHYIKGQRSIWKSKLLNQLTFEALKYIFFMFFIYLFWVNAKTKLLEQKVA